MMLGMMGKLLVNVIDKIKRHASIFIFFIGAYTIFIVGISHHRLETWLLYIITCTCIFIFFHDAIKLQYYWLQFLSHGCYLIPHS